MTHTEIVLSILLASMSAMMVFGWARAIQFMVAHSNVKTDLARADEHIQWLHEQVEYKLDTLLKQPGAENDKK